VGTEQLVVVCVDRRNHLLGLGHVRVDEPDVYVGRVVPLADGVDRELPVALDSRGEPVALRHQVERVSLHGEQDLAEEAAQRHRILGEVDEDEPCPDFAVHRRHAQLALVEVEELCLVGDVVDDAVKTVAPSVVLACERPATARGFLLRMFLPYHFVAAVRAHVVKACTLSSRSRVITMDASRPGSSRVK